VDGGGGGGVEEGEEGEEAAERCVSMRVIRLMSSRRTSEMFIFNEGVVDAGSFERASTIRSD